ncbi:MAG: GGDEF domain-containing protein [Gammaproteobacteria bacterium]
MPYQSTSLDMIKEQKAAQSLASNLTSADQMKAIDPVLEQQLRLDLATKLQMSLDINWVISQFMEHMHAYLLFDGYSYQNDGLDITVQLGRKSFHSCRYNLTLEEAGLGNISLFRGRKFSESELVLLENQLCQLVYPLRNAVQYHKASLLAYQDALTAVNNRSTFDATLEQEISLAKRQKTGLTLLMIDIDHFKSFNDNYGHSAGDNVLKSVANTLKTSTRDSDLVFRYGGEEFAIILRNSDCESSKVVAERILKSIRNNQVVHEDQMHSVSVSVGLSCLTKSDSSGSLFKRADDALYAAKNRGRDQLQVALTDSALTS